MVEQSVQHGNLILSMTVLGFDLVRVHVRAHLIDTFTDKLHDGCQIKEVDQISIPTAAIILSESQSCLHRALGILQARFQSQAGRVLR
jgi:hypothetical protein